jgi:hydrogenase-4 component B
MRTILGQKTILPVLADYFPARAEAGVDTPDWMKDRGFDVLFRAVKRFADWCKHLQHGHINLYILYILTTLVALLAWQVR